MKSKVARITILIFMPFTLSGCSAIGAKTVTISAIYAATSILAVFLLLGYFCLISPGNPWFRLLFTSVSVVNVGYYLLSVSQNLNQALWANRFSYLGSVFLPLSMLMILLHVTQIHYRKWLPSLLLTICFFVLSVTASPGYLPIYYKEVSHEIVNGTAFLRKVYGPWHSLYLVYLLTYFSAMIGIAFYATIKRKMFSLAHSVILIIAVLVNLGVWFVEQLVHLDVEMLSISYIITELFLLALHIFIQEQEAVKEQIILQHASQIIESTSSKSSSGKTTSELLTPAISEEDAQRFLEGLERLTPTERSIYDFYVLGTSTKEIMRQLNITENTLKFHNKNLYSKLGVSSRKQLTAISKHIKATQKENSI